MPASQLEFKSMGIGQLLHHGRLTVPPNQRSYAWQEEQALDLLQDVEEAISSNDSDYFLGTVVLVDDGNADPAIADGQQRLATTTLILARIRDRLLKMGRDARAASIDNDFLI